MAKPLYFSMLAIVLLLSVSCKQKKPVTGNDALLGDWQSITNEQLMVSFAINDEGQIYSLFNNGKLIETKTWQLNGNNLIIGTNASPAEILVLLNADTLIFNNGEEQFVKIYRIENSETDNSLSDTEILDDLNQNLGLKFSPIVPFNGNGLPVGFIWSRTTYPVEIVTNSHESLTDAYDQIITLLTLNGFEPDSNASEVNNLVYFTDSQRIIIRCNPPVDARIGDSLLIEILSGLPQ